jgi:hypothetical protein
VRRLWILLILLALAAVGFFATNWLLQGPRWALYQVGKAVHERSPSLFMAYVDVGRILSGQKDDIVDMLLPDPNRSEQRDFLRGVITAFLGTLTEQVNQQIIRVISDPQRENLPSSWTLAVAAKLDVNGDSALATLADPQSEQRLRLGMRRGDDGRWRVVEVNSQDLKALINRYVLKKREQGKASAPAPTPAPAEPPAPAAPAPEAAPAPAR